MLNYYRSIPNNYYCNYVLKHVRKEIKTDYIIVQFGLAIIASVISIYPANYCNHG